MVTKSVSLSNPIYEMANQLTGKPDINDALTKILKDYFELKIEASKRQIEAYEQKYGMFYAEFEEACNSGKIEDPYSYEVEKDDWEWEAAITDLAALEEISEDPKYHDFMKREITFRVEENLSK